MEAMISRLLEQEDAVRVVLSSDRKSSHLVLTWQDIHVLESMSKALSPVAELTDFLSGEKHVTVSSILPVLHNLATKVLLVQDDDSELTKGIKKKVIDSLSNRYAGNPQVRELLEVSTFLDPRFKMDYTQDSEKQNVIGLLREKLEEIIDNDTVIESISNSEAEQEPPPKKKKLLTFLQKKGSLIKYAVTVTTGKS